MSARVSNSYKLVIVWGGLRAHLCPGGREREHRPARDIRHFVAVLATGFVLFTLLVNGTTCSLLRLLHLDRLSKVDRAVRDRAIMLSLDAIRQRISAVAESDRISPTVTARICEGFAQRIADVRRTAAADVVLSDADLLQIGLITLATREQELHLQRYKERVVSRKSVQL
jgi:CPA1 family monovalent cation:H+ antiporter